MKARMFFPNALRLTLAVSLACSMALATYADSDHKREAANGGLAVDIDNFGKINDHYYRGAQPKGRNYEQLAAIGVKTIVDLREEAKSSSRAEAERAGLHYINLP